VPPLREHDLVRLTSDMSVGDGRSLPEGATGAIVGMWKDGLAYEVEFERPFRTVITVAASGLKPV
jgi:hypothetical protein